MPALVPDVILGEHPPLRHGEEIVISGLSGRLPNCANIEEFEENLMNNVDMVDDKETRWPKGLLGLPARSGKLKELDKFDAAFFGVHAKQATTMDPQMRILLEVTYEAIIDAGFNPEEIRGTKTGVFLGICSSESEDYWTNDPDKVNGYGLTGCCRAMIANRISYTFNFNGPSFAVDTACSSSFVALNQAVHSIMTGQCDAAIVAGCNLVLKPTMSLQFMRLNMLSPDGACKVFDASGDGYVRSESVVAMYIQKSSTARRNYATIVGIKTNTDGAKELGITFPSGQMQKKLIEEVYSECGINPLDVAFVEAHGTGTKAGDPQEMNALAEVFCKGRPEPLLVGSVKSNMGHSEGGSGLCSIAKMIIAMERGVIPANLHFNCPNPDIPALSDGRSQVVTKNTPWNGGYVAMNSFGFGGANVHLLLKSNPKPKPNPVISNIPKLVMVSGSTLEAVKHYINKLESEQQDDEMVALVHKIHNRKIPGHPFRGYAVLGDEGKMEIHELTSDEPRPVWYVFSGMGSQWVGMGRDLMVLEPFARSINKSAQALAENGLDLMYVLNKATDEEFNNNIIYSFVSIAAIQVALVDVLTWLGVSPDGIIGHSVGELGCAYADGTFTAEQTVLAAYWRGLAVTESNLIPGAMAAIGLSWEEAQRRVPDGIQCACHNGSDSVTISGPVNIMTQFVDQLKSEGVFAKMVNSNNIAFHSQYIAQSGPKLRASLEKLIPVAKARSKKWISTSIPESGWGSQLAAVSSAAYHTNNLLSPVLFHSAMAHVPERALVIEIAPHSLLQAILRRTLSKEAFIVGLTKKDTGLNTFLANIGKVYNAGLHPRVERLYRPVSLPVSRGTPMLSNMIQWDHTDSWEVADFSQTARSGESIIKVDLSSDEYKYIDGHTIDGRILFPATGYITLVWKTLAKMNQKIVDEFPVILEDVDFRRATIMPKEGVVSLMVNILEGSGDFEIMEGGGTVVTGKIYKATTEQLSVLDCSSRASKDLPWLTKPEIYRHLRLRGYDYKHIFKGIKSADNFGVTGELEWAENWVSFMDTMLQFSLVSKDTRELFLPTRLQRVHIDPVRHLEMAKKLNQGEGFKVEMDHYTGVFNAGGVQMKGLKANLAPKKELSHAPPRLEKYSFTPYFSDKETEEMTALTAMTHLVLENCRTSMLKVAEIGQGNIADYLISPKISEILDSEPLIEAELTVLTDDLENISNAMEQHGVQTSARDLASTALESKVHMIVAGSTETTISALGNIKASLLPGGFLLLQTLTKPPVKTMLASGFLPISETVSDRKHILLYRTNVEWRKPKRVVRVSQKNFSWLADLQTAMKKSETEAEPFVVLSDDEPDCGIMGLINCLKQEPGGENLRCVMGSDKKGMTVEGCLEQLSKDLLVNVVQGGVWGSMRHTPIGQAKDGLLKVEYAFINTLTRGDLSSLHWIESNLSFFKPELYPGLEMFTVYYAPLNFRDIMIATGKLPPDALPGQLVGQECVLGLEFVGRDKAGKRVMGIVPSQGLATGVVSQPVFLWPVPNNWTMEQAGTVPVVYTTSYYAVIVRGKMRRGERILVHAGTGGVGQATIAIALSMGCQVFTTVGTQAKKDFLLTTFPQLKESHIGNSRDTTFEQMVMTETQGQGVDLVLNSLAEDKLQASLRCLSVGGRFLEIGKFDLANNSPLGMSVLLKSTEIHGVLLDSLFSLEDTSTSIYERNMVVQLMTEGIASGVVRPLQATTFTTNQIEQMFRFMAAGKHMGKVILKVREEEKERVVIPKQVFVPAVPRTYMNPEKSYILVGGLGGFGLELASWLETRGARHLVMVSRSGVTSGYQAMILRRLNSLGVKVVVSTADTTTSKGAEQLLREADNLAPVGGIFNLAGILMDGILENQTAEQFSKVCRSKVDTTRALDMASRSLCPQMDYFVVFSSVSCGRGNAGQSNYGMANSAMERICVQRQQLGLPAAAIQWGAIGDVGMVIDGLGGDNESVVGGTVPQRMASCLTTVDLLLQQPHPVMASMVLAEKRGRGSDQGLSLPAAIANILGIKDVKTVNLNTSLANLGMDSLMGTEIKQTLERNFDMTLSPQEIRLLTFSKLYSISSGKGAPTQAQPAVVIEEQMQFQGNSLVPSETLVKLKEGSGNVFLVHPIEGDVSSLREMASLFPQAVWGLQASAQVNFSSIKDVASHYLQLIKGVQKVGEYLICGYSFGGCIAYEICVQLEADGEKTKLVMVDGSPQYIGRVILQSRRQDKDYTSDHSQALTYFLSLFKNIDFNQVYEELKAVSDGKERLKIVSDRLKEVIKFSEEEVLQAAELFYKKLVAGNAYKPSGTYHGQAILFKATDNYVSDGSEDYGLAKICSKPVTIHTIDSNHRGIIRGDNARNIVHILTNQFFKH